MALNHEFLLVNRDEFDYSDYMRLMGRKDAVSVHDDLLFYMKDSLNWIQCYNPARGLLPHKGLNFYGPTVIRKDGAVALGQIFLSWSSLFSVAPKRFQLTGAYEVTEGDSPSDGHYAKINVKRDEVVAGLSGVAAFAKAVETGPGDLFIMHLGI